MTVAISVIVLLVGLLLSIALHEVGHMVPAKKFGVRVSQYMVGFGPTLWSRTKGETEYGLKAIPAGGYVRLVGMYPPAPEGSRRRRGWAAEVTEAAREASLEEIVPGEEHRAFYRLSTPKKVVVMLGGPAMNLLIAVVLVVVVLSGWGVLGQTTTVSEVSDCVTPVTVSDGTVQDAPACGSLPQSPAQAAGLEVGDKVVAYAGQDVGSWAELTAAIHDHGTTATSMVVERAGQRVTLDVTPTSRTTTVDGTTTTGAALGFAGSVETVRQGVGASLSDTWDMVTGTAGLVVELPAKVVQVAQQTFGDEPRSADGPVSVVGVTRIAVDLSAGASAANAARSALLLLASLNVALFVFNLIPLVPLDGGHVVGALYEGARRQVARVRRRPVPGPADVARMTPVAYGVFVVLLAMGLLLIYADIVDPVRLT